MSWILEGRSRARVEAGKDGITGTRSRALAAQDLQRNIPMGKLTPKQECFYQEYIELGSRQVAEVAVVGLGMIRRLLASNHW
jgi:hypothetical protein